VAAAEESEVTVEIFPAADAEGSTEVAPELAVLAVTVVGAAAAEVTAVFDFDVPGAGPLFELGPDEEIDEVSFFNIHNDLSHNGIHRKISRLINQRSVGGSWSQTQFPVC
jgi:hypothetical protein